MLKIIGSADHEQYGTSLFQVSLIRLGAQEAFSVPVFVCSTGNHLDRRDQSQASRESELQALLTDTGVIAMVLDSEHLEGPALLTQCEHLTEDLNLSENPSSFHYSP